MEISDWIAIVELLVGIIIGCIGGKELHEANQLKIQFRDLNAKIEKFEINGSQIAGTINNNGVNAETVDYLANKIVDERTKNKPDIIISKEEPKGIKEGTSWLQEID